jgi:anti-sigma-K factor RskA
MTDHLRIEGFLAARALSGLDPVDAEELRRALSAHGDDCSECHRLEAEYQEVGGRLAFALAPAAVPRDMEDRIVADGPPRRAVSRRTWRVPRLIAAAAAAVLLVAGAIGGYLLAPRPAPGLEAVAEYVAQSGTRMTPLQGDGRGSLALAFGEGRRFSYLIGAGVQPAPSGKVYELWLRRDGRLQPAATFSGSDDVVAVRVPFDPSTATEAAVTLEVAPGAKTPSTNPIFRATIGA